jgi:peptidoglycan/LPS O-acetylase OafA/YrhL
MGSTSWLVGTRPPLLELTTYQNIAPVDHHHRVPVLDGLRGVAIGVVLVSHLTIYGFDRPSAGLEFWLFRIAQAGWIGVDLFFVLSGFLITGILRRARGTSRYFVTFYMRRALRILPLYAAFLVLACGVLPLMLQNERTAAWRAESLYYWPFLGNVLVATRGWTPSAGQGLNHFWSLAVEEQFYLVWPLVVWGLSRRRLVWVCVGAIGVSIALRVALVSAGEDLAAYVLTPARMDGLAAGALVALLFEADADAARLRRYARSLLFASTLMIVLLFAVRGGANPEDAPVATLGFALLAWWFASLLAHCLTSDRAGVTRFVGLAPLRWLGKYSYAIYVLHHPLLFLVNPHWLALTIDQRLHAPHMAQALAVLVLASLCIGLAVVSWYVLEQPFLRLKERWTMNDRRSLSEIQVAASVRV